MNEKFQFSTDTATIAIFDVRALKHRLEDDADWWSVPTFELAEVNLGNALIIALGLDGIYSVEATDDVRSSENSIVGALSCPSGKIYIGAGEDISGAGFDPENTRHLSGRILDVNPGTYSAVVSRQVNTISISFSPSQSSQRNSFQQPLELLS